MDDAKGSPVLRYLVRRVLWVAFVLLLITLITYLIFFLMPPTDPAVNFCGRQPTQECIAEVRHQFGLDKPVYAQYALFVKRVFIGDEYGWPGMGFSFNTRSALKPIILDRLGVTLQLAMGAAVLWVVMGIPIGVLSARRPRSGMDRAAMGVALFGVSAPVFWLGLMMLYVFWFKLGIASGSGFVPISEGFFTWLNHLIMPWTALALLYAAFYVRMLRGDLMDAMNEDYIRTARAKGLSERRVLYKHGLRAAITPMVTLFGVNLGTLLGGATVTETVFNIPGLGRFSLQAIRQGDLYALVDVTLIGAFFVVLANLVVDILYAFLNPRVRYS
ncbi:MAG: ABC transporter permease [Actinomycetota bacterium]